MRRLVADVDTTLGTDLGPTNRSQESGHLQNRAVRAAVRLYYAVVFQYVGPTYLSVQ